MSTKRRFRPVLSYASVTTYGHNDESLSQGESTTLLPCRERAWPLLCCCVMLLACTGYRAVLHNEKDSRPPVRSGLRKAPGCE